MKRRIFLSHTADDFLNSKQLEFKNKVISKIKDEGFIPEIFSISGSARELSWSFENVEKIIGNCCGAIIIAFPRWNLLDEDSNLYKMPSEYSHYEGAIAIKNKLPTMIITESNSLKRGITNTGGGQLITFLKEGSEMEYVNDERFVRDFSFWKKRIDDRFDLFIGYCSKSKSTAKELQLFLQNDLNVKVLDWATEFRAGDSILNQIERASKITSGGIFLFTNDDTLEGDEQLAAPRDNVVFETGYFINSKGKDRVLIIKEKGTKMPADIGGHIYLSLEDRSTISSIETQIRRFVERNF